MEIAGLQKMTLVDFPGRVAATVFTRGCSFRCPFCHNPELVLPEKFNPIIPEEQIFTFLESRIDKLDGVCITGGEPLINNDIDRFISHLKAIGFAVKLDTNGSFPEKLKKIIKDGDIDYIAMDIKSPIDNYQSIAKSKIKDQKLKIMKSIRLIMDSGIDYEFRTTVVKPFHKIEDFEKIGELIKGAKRYFIQNFASSKQVDSRMKFEPFTDKELAAAKKIMKKYVKEVSIR